MLSALLIGSTAIPVYAVDDTTNNMDTEEVLLEEEEEEEEDGGTEDGDTEDTVNTDDAETGQQDDTGSTDVGNDDTPDTDSKDKTDSTDVADVVNETTDETAKVDDSKESDKSEQGKEDESKSNSSEQGKEDVSKSSSSEQGKEDVSKSSSSEQGKEDVSKSSSSEQDKEDDSKTNSYEQGRENESKSSPDIKTGKQAIKCSVDFGCSFISNNSNDKHVDFSGVKITLLSADKKKVIKNFDTNAILSRSDEVGGFDLDNVELPDWGHDGDKYILRFENLPDIYTSAEQELPIECEVIHSDYENKDIVTGVDTLISVGLQLKEFNTVLFIYDINRDAAKNVEFDYDVETEDGKIINKGKARTTDSGCAIFTVSDKGMVDKFNDRYKLRISIRGVFNKSVVSSDVVFDYSYPVGGYCIYYIDADSSSDEYLYGEDGQPIVGTAEVAVQAYFEDINDMLLFKHSDIQLLAFAGTDVFNTLTLSRENNRDTFYGLSSDKYTLVGRSKDYSFKINPSTINVGKTDVVVVKSTPKLSLVVINENESGVKNNAHFKIKDYNNTFNEMEHRFSVNYGNTYTVVNLDTSAEYVVYIKEYAETVLNIYNGDIKVKGYAGEGIQDNDNNTSSDSNVQSENVISVPKTGDIIFGIIMILIGITGMSYLGYLYFKRKGSKWNENKR